MLTLITHQAARTAATLFVCSLAFGQSSDQPSRFDGKWSTEVTCSAKGDAIRVPTIIEGGNFRAEVGKSGEPGYLLITGKVADNGEATLAATGSFSYSVKAQFREALGNGAGHACKFEFYKQLKLSAE
jgi:hypothetical protein